MAEIDWDLGLRLNACLNLTFYFLIHPTLIKTHLVIYFQSHFSFLIYIDFIKVTLKLDFSNFIT